MAKVEIEFDDESRCISITYGDVFSFIDFEYGDPYIDGNKAETEIKEADGTDHPG
jgi:hypothetical protein